MTGYARRCYGDSIADGGSIPPASTILLRSSKMVPSIARTRATEGAAQWFRTQNSAPMFYTYLLIDSEGLWRCEIAFTSSFHLPRFHR